VYTGPLAPATASTAAAAAAGGDDDALLTAALSAAEAKLLARKLAAAEKQINALKEVFNKRVKAFRDSVRCAAVCGKVGRSLLQCVAG
jgi:hypothetical protein